MINENDLLPYTASSIPKGPYLVFAPHPDDETLGMGGTILLAAKSDIDVYIIFVTDGEKGGDPDVRREEAKAASEILGVKELFYLNLPDREVAFTEFPAQTLFSILEKVKPATIFLPSFQEIHPDHRATTQKVLNFIEQKNIEQKKLEFQIWFYEINRQGEINRLIDISSVLDLKESAIECYTSQLEQLDYKLHALCLNCMRSITLGYKINYAEGFWCYDAKDDAISPWQHYFNCFLNYIPQSQKIKKENELQLLGELRTLRDKVNNLKASILTYSNLLNALGKYINDKVNEVKLLREDNNSYIKLINDFEKKLSNIALSKSHRLASVYIKTMMELRHFFRNLIENRLTSANRGSRRYNDLCKQSCVENRDNDTNNCSSILENILITDGEEPIFRLYSENEIDSNKLQEHDVYIESTIYGKNRVQPLFNNKPIAFLIECSKKNLARIDLFMATYMRVNPGILRLSIYENVKNTDIQGEKAKIQEPIRVSNLMTPTILDNRFILFNFEPISDSEGKHFYITLSLVDGIDEMCPGIWINLNPKINAVEKYHQWIEQREKQYLSTDSLYSSISTQNSPYIAIVIPALSSSLVSRDNLKNLKMFSETIESVLKQSYPQWRLIILADIESDLKNFYSKYTQEHRITINYDLKDNIYDCLSLISLNRCTQISECSYFMVLNPLDTLAPNALEECINILNKFPDTDIIYSDEDKISKEGVRFEPFFKPDWSPDLLLSFMYMGNLILYKKELLQKTGAYFSIFETGQEKFKMLDQHNSRYSSLLGMYCQYDTLLGMYCQYDCLLRLTELTNNIHHIHKILYHKREILLENGEHNLRTIDDFNKADDFNKELSIKAIKDAINRRCLDADVYEGETKNSFRVSYRFDHSKLVSIIIPFKDNLEILHTCIQSILQKTKYPNYEIICVNNQSKNIEKFLEMDICGYGCINNFNSIYKKITIIDYDKPFNYSAINNFAVKHAKGDVLLFLNSDTEVISENWLNAMLEHACRDNVGAVGAKLYYVNDTIQHAGIVVGIAGLAGHAFKHIKRDEKDFYHGFPCMIRNVSAVTGACMMTKRSVFEEVGGFDEEHFKISYNDLDLCFKMREKGYQIIYTPFAELYHYESYSRGYSFDPIATDNIRAKWGKTLELDPFYNSNITIYKEDWSLE
ncbi:MAG: PIG-L family deacetylase [Desulfamplus sp.]|nr:PIG-L family deacetylase [Desulfamplus sp.]